MKCRAGLLSTVNELREGGLRGLVDGRLAEFEKLNDSGAETLFKELCFCILTANFTAEKSIRIQDVVGDGFITLSLKDLAGRLRELGHRFPNARAGYIVGARRHIPELARVLSELDGLELRQWFVDNVKGLGFKESSHFLRNIGFKDYAILDFHIIDVLVDCSILERPKTLSKKKYLEVEGLLAGIATDLGMSLSELDLYIWYLETGKILK